MYESYHLDRWKEQKTQLAQVSDFCPSCSTKVLVAPVLVDGIVLDSKRSHADALLFEIGGYSMFLPSILSNPGLAVVHCNECASTLWLNLTHMYGKGR